MMMARSTCLADSPCLKCAVEPVNVTWAERERERAPPCEASNGCYLFSFSLNDQ